MIEAFGIANHGSNLPFSLPPHIFPLHICLIFSFVIDHLLFLVLLASL